MMAAAEGFKLLLAAPGNLCRPLLPCLWRSSAAGTRLCRLNMQKCYLMGTALPVPDANLLIMHFGSPTDMPYICFWQGESGLRRGGVAAR